MLESLANAVPRLLFIVNRPDWAHDFKTRNLMRLLGGEYDIRLRYQSDVTEEDLDEANLIVVYFWLQFEQLQPLTSAFRRNRHKLLVGICSSYELEEERRERGLAVIRDLASAVFVNNLLLYHQYQPFLKIPTFYTPNGVDTTFFRPETTKAPSSRLRVGWAGSLTNRGPGYRGYHEFIVPAAAAVEGVELLTAAREDLWRGPEEMRQFYRSLDVYVCASQTEGTPNPCLEAAACGVPLVTTCVGNMPELVRHGVNGFIVERDVNEFARSLRALRDDSDLRTAMSAQIQQDIQPWDWSLRSHAYRKMFQEMLSKARAGDRVSFSNVEESIADGSDNSEFRVVALISAYNEEDIIVPCLQSLFKQGLEVYLIDNWSTDATVELASEFLGKGLLAIEKFPSGKPPAHYHWKDILLRIEQLTQEIDADWFLFQDVDEITTSPWPRLNLRDAILKVDLEGFNCIDQTGVTFHPIDDDFPAGGDFEEYFRYFDFCDRPGKFSEINAWKRLGRSISLAASGGHEIRFDGRRVYPFRFLQKHYPVRSQAHGEKKVFRERQARWLPQERAIGWHTHYDHLKAGDSFLRQPGDLSHFNESDFDQMSLNGSQVIDWTTEQIKALRSQPDRILTLVNLELKKTNESVQSLATQLASQKLAGESDGLEGRIATFERLSAQLAHRNWSVQALVDQMAEGRDEIDSLASELSETRKLARTLVALVADRKAEVEMGKAPATKQEDRNTAISSSLSTLAPRGTLRYAFLRSCYRLLKRD